MSEWQPIETAPYNRWILGYYPSDFMANEGEDHAMWVVRKVDQRWWSDEEPHHWYGDHHTVETGNHKEEPLFWMPLPEAPAP